MVSKRIIVAAAAVFFAAHSLAIAAESTAVTREEFPKLLENTLAENPEIIMKALDKLREKQKTKAHEDAQAGLKKNFDALFKNPDSPSIGADNADVTIVEFYDYHCGYCKHFLPELVKLLDSDKKVRIVFKDLPILSEDSTTAAKASIAAFRLNKAKFFEFHQALMAEKGKFDEQKVSAIAKNLGIDPIKLKAEMAKPELEKILQKDRELADDLGIRGTPAIVVGNQVIPGAIGFDELKKLVDDTRKSAAEKK